MSKKLLALLLLIATTAITFVGCANPQGETTTTTGDRINSSTPVLNGLNFPSEGFADDDLVVYVAYVEDNVGFTRRSLQADELDETAVDIKTLERDQRLKSQLGLELYIDPVTSDFHNMESVIGTALAAGESDYDIIAGYQYFGISMATKGYLYDLSKLEVENADYIDLKAPYWGEAYNDNLSYNGAYYWITGDIALRYIGGMYCTFINSSIYTDKLESTYGSIYDIAKHGKWTIDLLTTMAAECYDDNGTIPGEADPDDQFGFGWEAQDPMDGLAMGMNVEFAYKNNETGEVIITFNNKHTIAVSEKIAALANNKAFSYKFESSDSANTMNAFASGSIAFTVNKLFQAEAYLSEMEDDYYIIPTPKFDENQTNYITAIHDGCTIFGITHCSEKVRQSAAALEFLCAYSHSLVAPEYYEGALKGRYTRDPYAAEMIDIIHTNVSTDFAAAWSNSINGIVHTFRDGRALKSSDLNRKQGTWNESLKKLLNDLTTVQENNENT